jgi:hypothetical protein
MSRADAKGHRDFFRPLGEAPKRRARDDDRSPPDPEMTRIAFSSLTRCDHCNRLDGKTRATLERNEHPGDGWLWLHPECLALYQPPDVRRLEDSKGRLILKPTRGGMAMSLEEALTRHKCDYCGIDVGNIQLIAVGQPGKLEVFEAWLHPECEHAYLHMMFPEEGP